MRVLLVILLSLFASSIWAKTISPQDIDNRLSQAENQFVSTNPEIYIKFCQRIFKDSQQISYSKGIAWSGLKICAIFDLFGEYQKADYYLKIAKNEDYAKESELFQTHINIILAERYKRIGLYKESLSYYKLGLPLKGELNTSCLGALYSGIGESFLKLNVNDSALIYLRRSYKILKNAKTVFDKSALSVACGNIGILLGKLKNDSAAFFLNEASSVAKQAKDNGSIANAEKCKGIFYLDKRQIDSAIVHFQSSLQLNESIKASYNICELYEYLYLSYRLNKEIDKCAYYQDLYQTLSDNLAERKNSSILIKSMVDDNQDVTNRSEAGLTYWLLFIVVLAIGIIIWICYRIRHHQIHGNLSKIEKEKLFSSVSEVTKQQENEVVDKLVKLSKTKDALFFVKFNELYPGFRSRMLQMFPDLNNTDLEFCTYLKMRFSTKEIAHLSNTSLRAVETKKYRIRRKLQVPPSENLSDFIITISK
ncbi:helix-turn-helix transcriptional regulator [Pedobacter nototheniae]|uniref:helix-turn-helix transcriptional regulator n=1 Tax=Pedobacter nototheniae TaxID=2488994 RepID=UPI00103AA3BD|nr:hypothetical protein [Pedobacter nototheniae]